MPGEGAKPRHVDNDAEPVMSHNKEPLNEPYPATGINPTERNPEGVNDEEQIMELTQAETAYAPIGPDTMAGGVLPPMPPVPDGVHDPTSQTSGAFGGPEEFKGRDLKEQEE